MLKDGSFGAWVEAGYPVEASVSAAAEVLVGGFGAWAETGYPLTEMAMP